jgi:hypothetical protein
VNAKITLITPPDFFENGNLSILFAHIDDEEQDFISRWLAKHDITNDINLYVYSGEVNVSWFLYAVNRCEYKYINIDNINYISQALQGYVLTKNDVFYKTQDENLVGVFSHINSNRIVQVENFLERVLGDKKSKYTL